MGRDQGVGHYGPAHLWVVSHDGRGREGVGPGQGPGKLLLWVGGLGEREL